MLVAIVYFVLTIPGMSYDSYNDIEAFERNRKKALKLIEDIGFLVNQKQRGRKDGDSTAQVQIDLSFFTLICKGREKK